MTLHPQVHIEWDGEEAEVDEGIAPLILAIWKNRLWTMNSCQDNFGRVWVEMPASDAEQFLNIAAGPVDPDLESLHNRVTGEWVPEGDWESFRRDRAWRYDVHPENLARPEDEPNIQFSVSIRFSFGDLPEVIRRLEASATKILKAEGGEPDSPCPERREEEEVA
jgi:hypothetical protein